LTSARRTSSKNEKLLPFASTIAVLSSTRPVTPKDVIVPRAGLAGSSVIA